MAADVELSKEEVQEVWDVINSIGVKGDRYYGGDASKAHLSWMISREYKDARDLPEVIRMQQGGATPRDTAGKIASRESVGAFDKSIAFTASNRRARHS